MQLNRRTSDVLKKTGDKFASLLLLERKHRAFVALQSLIQRTLGADAWADLGGELTKDINCHRSGHSQGHLVVRGFDACVLLAIQFLDRSDLALLV